MKKLIAIASRAMIVAVMSLGLSGFLISVPALAQSKADICRGVGLAGGSDDCTTADGESTVEGVIGTVVNVLSMVVGFVAVIMIIIGGFKYITSGGDSSSVSSAKNTIIFAIVGLVIVAFAQIIVRYVLNEAVPTT